jgi:hypothetical protein
MNSNCRQTLAALLGRKERISQSIYMNKRIRIIGSIKFPGIFEQHSEAEAECHE